MTHVMTWRFYAFLLFALTLALPPTDSLFAANWPQFRGPGGNATAVETVPLNWSSTENIAWKTPLPGRGSSSPIVWGDRVFLTAFTGYGMSADDPGNKADLRLHLLCIDRNNGQIVWNKSIAANEHTQNASQRVLDHGYATATPTTDGEAVYAFFGVSGVVAYDFDGNLQWRADVGTKTAGFGSASSPVLFENLLLVNASIESQTLFAFDKKTGDVVWEYGPINKAWTSPSVVPLADGKHELVLNHKDVILGLDPQTGEELWSCAGILDYIVPVPIHHEGVAYCLGGRSNRCIAIKLGGRGDVTATHKLWEVNIGANVTSPVYYKGRLYWSSDKGIANCLDAATGEPVFRNRLPTRSRVYASIVRAGDRLYITMRDRGMLVLKAGETYEELAQNVIETDDDLINASPAISDGQLFLRTDSFLYCIAEKEDN